MTRAYKTYLLGVISDKIKKSVEIDSTIESLEAQAIKDLKLKFFVSGLSQAISFDDIADMIISREPKRGAEKNGY